MIRSVRKLMKYFLSLALPLFLMVAYQNCGKGVSFEKIEADSTQGGLQTGPCAYGCREGKLDPEVKTVKPPVKVVFVVDNSRSMSAAQEYLAEGVKGLLQKLKGFDASFFVHTTTQTGTKQIVGAATSKCSWDEGLTPVSAATCPNDQENTYNLEKLFPLAPVVTNQPYAISANMSEAEFQAVEDALSHDIANVGVDGSNDEQGICSLTRTVYDHSANHIFSAGDTAAFVLISDEQDFSTPATCLSREVNSTTYRKKSDTTGACVAGSACDLYNYTVTFADRPNFKSKISFSCPGSGNKRVDCNLATETCAEADYTVSMSGPVSKSAQKSYSCMEPTYDDGVVTGSSPGAVLSVTTDASDCSASGTVDLASSDCAASCGAKPVATCKRVCTVNNPTSKYTYTEMNAALVSTDFCGSAFKGSPNIKDYALGQSGNAGKVVTGCSRAGKKFVPADATSASLAWDVSACPSSFDVTTKAADMKSKCGGSDPINPVYSCVSSPIAVSETCKFPDRANTTQNLCNTGFTYNGVNYSDMKDYCFKTKQSTVTNLTQPQNCSRDQGSRVISQPGVELATSVKKSYTFPENKLPQEVANLADSFNSRASELFGPNGYFVSAIIRDQDADGNVQGCEPLQAYESYGSKYRNLVASTPNGGDVTSICASDYGDTLSRVQKFVRESTERSYVVSDLGLNEKISEVWLEKGETKLSLMIGVDVTITGPRIEFTDPTILEKGMKIGYRLEKF